MEFVGALALILLGTQLVGQLCIRAGIPDVIGQIVFGIIVGPAVLGLVQPNAMIN